MDEASAVIDRDGPEFIDERWFDQRWADERWADQRWVDEDYRDADAGWLGDPAPATAERRIDQTITRIEEAACRSTREMATQLAGIDDLLREAERNPQVFAGSRCMPGAETAQFAKRSAVCELAVTLGVSESTVHIWAATAAMLRGWLPAVWCAFQDGEISYPKVRIIVEAASNLPLDAEVLARFDAIMCAAAVRLTPSKLRLKARGAVELLHPEPAEMRHVKARTDRRFWVDPAENGMAWLGALLPADAAMRAKARVEANARHLAAQHDETRTLAQLRADVAAAILTGDGTTNEVTATVSITVPVLTLLGSGLPGTGEVPADYRANPAVLNGYGPIDADTARRFCAKAPSLFRLLTDPIDGAILTVDRKSYRPPADLKRLVNALRPFCSFPACNRLAHDCDIDHSLDWVLDGRTKLHNLAPVCRHHHRIKHMTRWRMIRDQDSGDMTWISPRDTRRGTDPPPF